MDEKIEQLINELLSGIILDDDREYLERKLREDPAVRAYFEAYSSQFSTSDLANNFARFRPDTPMPEGVSRPDTDTRSLTARPQRRRFLPVGIAAGLLLALGLSYYMLRVHHKAPLVAQTSKEVTLLLANGQSIDLSTLQDSLVSSTVTLKVGAHGLHYTASSADHTGMNTLTVPAGRDYKVILPDGTMLHANSTTTVRFPTAFNGPTREIEVDGEVYLDVAAKAGQPFLVKLPQGTVEVLGTAFNVNTFDPAHFRVALNTGKVNVRKDGQLVTLVPGKAAELGADGQLQRKDFDARMEFSWRSGLHYFEDANLDEVVDILKKWYQVDVDIQGAQHAHPIQFSGYLDRNEPLETFLNHLIQAAAIKSFALPAQGDCVLTL